MSQSPNDELNLKSKLGQKVVVVKSTTSPLSPILGIISGLLLALLLWFLFSRFFFPGLAASGESPRFNPEPLVAANVSMLQSEIAKYRNALNGDVCGTERVPGATSFFETPSTGSNSGSLSSQGGSSQGGSSQGGSNQGGSNQGSSNQGGSNQGGSTQEGSNQAGSNQTDPNQAQESPSELISKIEQATVFILNVGTTGSATGTGFFISPNLILTNYHVVDLDDPDAEILVTNHSLGELHKAELVKYSSDGNLADFAVLRLTGSGSESYLPIAPNQGERTQRVSAWGYPGLLLESDPMMEALAEGDFSAVPELVYTEGVISVIQNFPGISLISHTAEVSHGNSGGPLINQKGEVLGINTMIRVDEESNRQVNMALGGPNLNEFLASIN